MVQSFLWMQLRQKTDNQGVTRRSLATMVAQRFNRGRHTGRQIIHWEKKWIATRKISSTKAGKNKHTLSWMDDEDLVMAIKSRAKSKGDGKCLYNNC